MQIELYYVFFIIIFEMLMKRFLTGSPDTPEES